MKVYDLLGGIDLIDLIMGEYAFNCPTGKSLYDD